MKFFVYSILDPRKVDSKFGYEPFYIGKGKGDRASIQKQRNNYCTNKINKIRRLGLKPIIKIVAQNMYEEDAFKLEVELIKNIGRLDEKKGPLLNLTDGGEGCSGYSMSFNSRNKIAFRRFGCRHSEETKKRISEIKKNKGLKLSDKQKNILIKANKGRKLPIWVRELNSIRMKGEKNPNWNGKSFTEQNLKERSKRMLGSGNHFFDKKHTSETKKKLSENAKKRIGNKNPFFGRSHSEVTKEKISQAFRKIWILNKGAHSVIVDNLKFFCEHNNLCYSNMRKTACGLQGSCGGWRILKTIQGIKQ